MVRASVLLLIAACGRLNFDANGTAAPDDAQQVTVDAPPDAVAIVDCTTLPDGTPCDDRNVCTPQSFCFQGTCLTAQGGGTCTLTESDVDFSNVQGDNGWWYGFWTANGSYDPDAIELGVWDGSDAWDAPTDPRPYLFLTYWGTHATISPVRFTVRRWVSDTSGPAMVTVHVDKSDVACGDGIEARLAVDGAIQWTELLDADDGIGFTRTDPVELEVGTRVDLLIGPRMLEECDACNTVMTIESP